MFIFNVSMAKFVDKTKMQQWQTEVLQIEMMIHVNQTVFVRVWIHHS